MAKYNAVGFMQVANSQRTVIANFTMCKGDFNWLPADQITLLKATQNDKRDIMGLFFLLRSPTQPALTQAYVSSLYLLAQLVNPATKLSRR